MDELKNKKIRSFQERAFLVDIVKV